MLISTPFTAIALVVLAHLNWLWAAQYFSPLALVTTGAVMSADDRHETSQANSSAPRAAILKRVAPEYTPEARAAGLEGSVLLYVEVNTKSELETVHVMQSLGMGLDEKAVEAVKQWQFAAGTKNGVPVRTEQSLEVSFLLNPITPWLIKRCSYHVRASRTDQPKQTVEPVLTKYVSPDPKACVSNMGIAVAHFDITQKGRVKKARAAKGTANAVGDAAIEAISNWIFDPGTRSGKPAEGNGIVELECRPIQTIDARFPESDAADPIMSSTNMNVAPPKLVYKVEPEYSEEARRARATGKVFLSIEIDRSGHVVNMAVVRPLGLGLDERAMQAASQWRFEPSIREGSPVAVWATVEVTFKLV